MCAQVTQVIFGFLSIQSKNAFQSPEISLDHLKMAYVLPHLRKKLAAAAAPVPAGVRFIGNVTGSTNAEENTGRRYSPRRNATVRKGTLKRRPAVTPNSAPAARPTTRVSKMPAKFRGAVYRAIGYKKTQKKTRKHRRVTRRHHAKYTKR